MDDVHAKEIHLIHTTVKIPGLRPRTTKTVPNYPAQHPNQDAKGESKTSFSLSGECPAWTFIMSYIRFITVLTVSHDAWLKVRLWSHGDDDVAVVAYEACCM